MKPLAFLFVLTTSAFASEWSVDPAHSTAQLAVRRLLLFHGQRQPGKLSGSIILDDCVVSGCSSASSDADASDGSSSPVDPSDLEAGGGRSDFGSHAELTGKERSNIRSLPWLDVRDLPGGVVRIGAAKECFTPSEAVAGKLQTELRALLYPGRELEPSEGAS
jgi:hypothetical protein